LKSRDNDCFTQVTFQLASPARSAQPSALARDIVPRIGGCIENSHLKQWKPSLQFGGTHFGAFLGRELGLHATIDFKRESGLRQPVGLVCHLESRMFFDDSRITVSLPTLQVFP
jgi:hypothetical protein